MFDMIEKTMLSFLALLGIGLILVLFVALYDGLTGKSCKGYAEATGNNYEYRIFGGCFIEYEGKMISQDSHKAVDGNKLEVDLSQ